jgi:TetR/AcrR family transcriptional repressor of mexJK operon
VYNHYADKDALFTQVVEDVITYAEAFARGLRQEFTAEITAANLRATLDDLGRRVALAIVRPEVVALRRLLIGEARAFPALARNYFDRAPGQVIEALASGFEQLGRAGLLGVPDAPRAAAQFAYLVAGEPLDRAILAGTIPPREHVIACAREGVETFLARYAATRGGHGTGG